MPDYTYTALAGTGAKSTGVISAGSDREAAAFLDAKGLFPIAITEKNTTGASGFSFGSGIGGRELSTMYGLLVVWCFTGWLRCLGSEPVCHLILHQVVGVPVGAGWATAGLP